MTAEDDIERELDAIFHDRRPATADDIRSLSNELQGVIIRLNDIEDAVREARYNARAANKNIELVLLALLAFFIVAAWNWLAG